MKVNSSLSTKRKGAKAAQNRADVIVHRSINTLSASRPPVERVLVIDIGGRSVKILATGQMQSRSFRSGPTLTPGRMVEGVKKLAADWRYDVVSIGYPGPVLGGRPIAEPYNLGPGWIGFDFARAFDRPVKLVNDAAMQALGSYKGGKMLFLGLGTGLGTAMIVEGIVAPMEIGHLPHGKGTYEDYVGRAGLKRYGKKKWRRHVADVRGTPYRRAAARQDRRRQCCQAFKHRRHIVARATMPTLSAADLRYGLPQLPRSEPYEQPTESSQLEHAVYCRDACPRDTKTHGSKGKMPGS